MRGRLLLRRAITQEGAVEFERSGFVISGGRERAGVVHVGRRARQVHVEGRLANAPRLVPLSGRDQLLEQKLVGSAVVLVETRDVAQCGEGVSISLFGSRQVE